MRGGSEIPKYSALLPWNRTVAEYTTDLLKQVPSTGQARFWHLQPPSCSSFPPAIYLLRNNWCNNNQLVH